MKEGPQHNDHSHFGSRKVLLPRIWSTWDHQEGCAHAAPRTSSQPEACLWRGGKWDTSHACVDAGLFPSQAQQYLVTLSADLRPAYSSFRPLVPPQQRLLFSVTALLCHKGFFSTRLQGSLFPKKSSFSCSLTSISKFSRKQGKQCLSYNDPVRAFCDFLASQDMPTTELHCGVIEGPSRVPGPLADQGVDRTFSCPCTSCLVLSHHW